MELLGEAVVLALWLVLPLLGALLVAGGVSTVLGWWLGHVDASLSTGLRWALVLLAIGLTAHVGGRRMVAFAGKAFSAASVVAAPPQPGEPGR